MKDKKGGWWPSGVPNPAAAARRVSWWPGRSTSPPPAQRPTSLVIVHCGPSTSTTTTVSPSILQRPSCSPPPPPPRSPPPAPPRSPAASSYATCDDEEEEESQNLELPPETQDGDLLQGILEIIEKKGKADCTDQQSNSEHQQQSTEAQQSNSEQTIEEQSNNQINPQQSMTESNSEQAISQKQQLNIQQSDSIKQQPNNDQKTISQTTEQQLNIQQNITAVQQSTSEQTISQEQQLNIVQQLDSIEQQSKKDQTISQTREQQLNIQQSTVVQQINSEVLEKSIPSSLETSNNNEIVQSAETTSNSTLMSEKPITETIEKSNTQVSENSNNSASSKIQISENTEINKHTNTLITEKIVIPTSENLNTQQNSDNKNIQKISETPNTNEIIAEKVKPEICNNSEINQCTNPFLNNPFATNPFNPFQQSNSTIRDHNNQILSDTQQNLNKEDTNSTIKPITIENIIEKTCAIETNSMKTEKLNNSDSKSTPIESIGEIDRQCSALDAQINQIFSELNDIAKIQEAQTPLSQNNETIKNAPGKRIVDIDIEENKNLTTIELNLDKNEPKLEKNGNENVESKEISEKTHKENEIKETTEENKNLEINTSEPNNNKIEISIEKSSNSKEKKADLELDEACALPEGTVAPLAVEECKPDDDTFSSSDILEDRDGDLTLDDAADLTLDDESSEELPRDQPPADPYNKLVEEEDEYFEFAAKTGHYENVEYPNKNRPSRKLMPHPPKLGAVKTGLKSAWVAVKDWGNEGARKIGEWARESSVPQEEGGEGAPGPPPPPLKPRAIQISPPRLRKKRGATDTAHQAAARRSKFLPHEGQSGFDELRRYMKQGGDFCKELSVILQERADAEAQYAKSLSKLSAKLSRSAKDTVGSVSAAWQQVAIEMEAESEAHRDASSALAEKVVRPLRATIETHHRMRKSVESGVDKTSKGLMEWRVAECKAKKNSFASARDNERLHDSLQEAHRIGTRAGRTAATLSEKDIAKLESKRRKAEEAVKKADVEYYTFCIRAERARLEWETAVSRGGQCFQELEEQRLTHLKELLEAYLQLIAQLGPRIVQSSERLTPPVQECEVARDLHTVASVKGVGQPIPEQLLPDFYPEHVTLAMNRERRRLALAKLLQLIRQDLERERRAKHGVENLARALQQTPTFGTEDSQQNVSDKLHHMRSMLTYLEAARYKVHSALSELDGQNRGSHPLASHIQVTRDRQGLQQSILKVPPWVREESLEIGGDPASDWPDRGTADGTSVQPDSDFDEFSSQASDEIHCNTKDFPATIPEVCCTDLGQCRALYDYTANLCDELNLRTGDVICIREKQEDGWWLGELNGIVGIFPATYVEDVVDNK